jgi:hypothetical protein
VIVAAFFLGLGAGLVCATSDVARNTIAHNFHADFITLSLIFKASLQTAMSFRWGNEIYSRLHFFPLNLLFHSPFTLEQQTQLHPTSR